MATQDEAPSVWDECRRLVAEDELETALGMAESFLKGRTTGSLALQVRKLLDTLLMIRARGRRLVTRSLDGTLSSAEEQAERNRLARSVLDLVTEIEKLDELHSPFVSIDLKSASTAEKLMGTESHLRSTGWLNEGLRLATAVCRLTDGQVFGTGFRCHRNIVATNNHVIKSKEAARAFGAQFFFEEDAAGTLRVPFVVELDPDQLFWTSETLDVTLVGTSAITRDDIATIPLRASVTARVGERVSIIQHPNGGPKQIAVTNNRILNLYGHRVQYLTDTLPGSSGSPVFLDNWSALAIHHAGGNMLKDSSGRVIFANEGISVAALFRDESFASHFSGEPRAK